MKLKVGQIIRFKVLKNLFKGKEGLARIEKFETVPENTSPYGRQVFRPGDVLVMVAFKKEGGGFDPPARFQPGEIAFAPKDEGEFETYQRSDFNG